MRKGRKKAFSNVPLRDDASAPAPPEATIPSDQADAGPEQPTAAEPLLAPETLPPASGGTPRSVESMLQEFSGGDSAVPAGRSGGQPSGKYDQLWQLSMADPHTGLANQLLLLDRLSQALTRRRRHGGEVVVCHIDLENLGEINLDLGYTTGNAVLCEGARRLTAMLRAEDTVGRVGGSELVVVVTVNDEQDAAPLVRRLQQTLEEPVLVGGQKIRLHAAFGVAKADADETAEDVLARADRSTRVGHP